ncbi:P-selectin glycoprotein ligand 1 [Tyto alba]|uniref:P-selectin glycoprotein ligand 1 n=1 Tax=Tyto alba TaxID=56313 RepID=UPI001C674423|nr:P-selectin glycoprotein ligand 1 [Tyto alba]
MSPGTQLSRATSGAEPARGGHPQGTQPTGKRQEVPFLGCDPRPIAATLTVGLTQPLALGGPFSRRDVLPVPGSPKPQPPFRARLPFPARAGGAGGGRPTMPPRISAVAQPWGCRRAPVPVMPTGAEAPGPAASPGRGPMVPGWAVLVVLVLSTLWVCGAVPPPEQHRGGLWLWGAAGPAQAEPPPLSRRRKAESGQQPSATTAILGHGHAATVPLSSNKTDSPQPDQLLGEPGHAAGLRRARAAPTAANLLDETDSPEPDLLLSSAPSLAPSTKASPPRGLVVTTTADLDETDSPDPDLLLSSAPPPAPSTNASPPRALTVPTTTNPLDETDSPEPDLLLSSAPSPAPSTNTSPPRALVVPTTADPLDETDSPEPDLLLSSEPPPAPGTQAAPQKSVTTIPSQLTSLSEEETVAHGTEGSSSTGPRSETPPSFNSTTAGYKKVKKPDAPPTPTRSAPWDTKPVPWDPSRVMGKCLLAILLLALVAATFMVCTGVLGALLWRRARTAHRRLSRTEMVCISSLLPDGELAANGPKPCPAPRQKLLPDGGSEADGDNLTLSSFLPEHP